MYISRDAACRVRVNMQIFRSLGTAWADAAGRVPIYIHFALAFDTLSVKSGGVVLYPSENGRPQRFPQRQRRRESCRIGSHRLAAFAVCGERTLLEHRTDGTDAFSPIRSKLLRGRYALHQLREISVSRRFLAVDERRIINFLFLLSVLQVA